MAEKGYYERAKRNAYTGAAVGGAAAGTGAYKFIRRGPAGSRGLAASGAASAGALGATAGLVAGGKMTRTKKELDRAKAKNKKRLKRFKKNMSTSAFGVDHGVISKKISVNAPKGIYRGILTTSSKNPAGGGASARQMAGGARPALGGKGVQLARKEAKRQGKAAGKLMAQRRGAGEAPTRIGWDPAQESATVGRNFKASAVAGSTPKGRSAPVGMRGSARDRLSWTQNKFN